MAWITLQDQTGVIEGIAFSDVYARHQALLQTDTVILLIGRVDRRRGEPSVVVDRILEIEQAANELASSIDITLDLRNAPAERAEIALGSLREFLHGASSGRGAEVLLRLRVPGGRVVTIRPAMVRLAAEPMTLAAIEAIAGIGSVRLRRGPASAYAGQRGGGNGHRDGSGRALQPARLARNGTPVAGSEMCASLDRY
jgi:DNA polymerase-3 subunit alpha